MADYGRKVKEASSAMGQASSKAHKAIDEILRLIAEPELSTDRVRMQAGMAKAALHDIRTSRDQLVSWTELAIEALRLAQQQLRSRKTRQNKNR